MLDLERLDNGLPFGRLSFEESDGDDCQSALEGDVVFMQYFAAQGVADDNTMWWRGLDEVMEANPTTTTLDLVIAVFPDTLQDDSSNASIDTATLSKQTPNLETIEISIDRAELRFKAAEVDDGYLPVDPELPTTQPLSKLLTDSVKHAFHHLQNQKPEWHEPCVDAKEFIAAIGLDLSKDLYRLLTKRTPVLTGATATKRTFGQRDSPDIED